MEDNCDGWVCFHRKTVFSMVFKNEGVFKIWMWCLAKANHKKSWVKVTTGRGSSSLEILPGQFIFGRKSAAKELDMDENTIYKRMKKLEKAQNLTIESNNKYSIVSIVNWDIYQKPKEKSNTDVTKQVTSKYQPSNTDNNDNNENKEGLLSSEIPDDDLESKQNEKVPYKEIINLFHEILPEFPPIIKLNDTRRTALRGRWNTEAKTKSLDWWKEYFEWIRDSDFLMGRTKKPFACGFDWIIKSSNFIKIREGTYHR